MVDTESEQTAIRIAKPLAEQLKALGQKGETYNDIVERLLSQAKINVPVDSALYGFFLQLVEDMGTGAKVVDVGSGLGEMAAKFGAVSGFRGKNFRDWGVQKTAKATMITFLGIDDPFKLMGTMMSQSISTLIERFGAYEFKPVLEQALEALAVAFIRLFPEEEGRS